MSMGVQGLPSSQISPSEKLLLQPFCSSELSRVQGSLSLQELGSATQAPASQWLIVRNSPSSQAPESSFVPTQVVPAQASPLVQGLPSSQAPSEVVNVQLELLLLALGSVVMDSMVAVFPTVTPAPMHWLTWATMVQVVVEPSAMEKFVQSIRFVVSSGSEMQPTLLVLNPSSTKRPRKVRLGSRASVKRTSCAMSELLFVTVIVYSTRELVGTGLSGPT